MNCELASTTVHAYFDGELDAIRSTQFEAHAAVCAECGGQLKALGALRKQIRESDLFEQASPQLVNRVQKQLGRQKSETQAGFFYSRRLILPFGAFAALAASLAIFFFFFQGHSRSAQVTAALLDAHVRSLQPGHLTDILSTDQHTVKPWFDGKLDFVPPVMDFSPQGFPLIGGRLDVIDGHDAAVLVYGRRKHIVNLFVWPRRANGTDLASSGSQQGYGWLWWESGGMEFCLISDTSGEDIRQLRDLIRQQSR